VAVDTTTALDARDFERFPGRQDRAGLVGTFSLDLEDTGEAGGGTMTIRASLTNRVLGFKPFIVLSALSWIASSDPGNVQIQLGVAGANARLEEGINWASDAVNVGVNYMTPEYVLPRVLFEPPRDGAPGTFASVLFNTNTDATLYHVHAQGLVFDAEALTKSGDYGKLLEAMLA